MSNKNVKPSETGRAAEPADHLPDLLSELERGAISSLQAALSSVRTLSDARLLAKLSVSRLVGVSRELRELIKVMSVYGC